MKKIFLFLFGLIVLACSPKFTMYDDGMDRKISMAQFDSMCVADTLPRNLGHWHFLELRYYKKKQRTALFMLIKENGIVYKAEETMDDSVKIMKKKIIILEE